MLRTTCVATMLEGGHASNALPQLAAATVNCRVMPDDPPDYVLNSLRTAIADNEVTVSSTRTSSAVPGSALRTDLMKRIHTDYGHSLAGRDRDSLDVDGRDRR